MSVAIPAQVPVAASSPATASPQASPSPSTGTTSEQGLVDLFAKVRVDAGNGQVAEATNSVASSGEMLGKLREFVEMAHQLDAKNQATRAKQRLAGAEAELDLASLDTLGSLGKLNSQFNPIGHSRSFGQLASHDGFGRAGLPPGPASASLGPGPGLDMKDRASAMVDKMTNDAMNTAIHHMWTQVVANASKSLTNSMMTLIKGQ